MRTENGIQPSQQRIKNHNPVCLAHKPHFNFLKQTHCKVQFSDELYLEP